MSTQPTVLSDLSGSATAATDGDVVLRVRDLSVRFPSDEGLVNAVSDLSYDARLGRTLAIVGESGSGKSVSSMSVLGLHNPKRTLMSGSIMLDGQEIVGASPAKLQKVRSSTVAMVFQDPQSSLHPFYRIGNQIAEAYRAHHHVSKAVAMKRAVEMLDLVGIPNPDRRARSYPHEFSGGMRQRAMIALGLVNNPKLLIADEPTTALDVTVQAQILDLLKDLQREFGSAIVLITHDLAVVAEVADDILVMYAGRAVERGLAKEVLADPLHPYTWGLLQSLPSTSEEQDRLRAIRGAPPSLVALPTGCSFHPRCDFQSVVGGDACVSDHARAHPRAGGQHPVDPLPPARPARRPERGDPAMSELLKVTDLVKHFPVREMQGLRMVRGDVRAVDGVSFTVNQGETLGLVGESGCGKSTTSRLVTRLLEPTSGSILFEGTELAGASEAKLRPFRRDLQIVFQDPYSSLNPRHTVATILSTPLRVHGLAKGREKQRVQELLELVGLNPEHINRYPQRVLGRPAPADRHRAGARGGAEADHRRRARLGPGRLDPGPGDEPARHAAQGARPGLHLHRPRPRRRAPLLRPGRRHVPRQDRRAGRPPADLHGAAAPVHAGAAVRGPGHQRRAGRAAEGADPPRRRRAQPGEPAERLPVPHALLEGAGRLRHHGAGAGDGERRRARAHAGLPLPGGQDRPHGRGPGLTGRRGKVSRVRDHRGAAAAPPQLREVRM